MAFSVMNALAHGLGPHCDWRIIATSRTGVALIIALFLAWSGNVRLVFLRPASLWLRSLAGSVSVFCTFYALSRLPIGDVTALANLFPLWVALLSWPMLGIFPTGKTWLAVVCGICGLLLVQQPHFAEQNFSSLVAVASSFSTSLAMLGLHRLRGIDPRAIVVHFSAVSLICCLAVFLIFPWPQEELRDVAPRDTGAHAIEPTAAAAPAHQIDWPEGWVLAMLLGIGASATLGQILLTKAFAAGAPARVSVVGLTQVVFGMLLDCWIWSRQIELVTWMGVLLILGPTAWLMLRPTAVVSRSVPLAD